ncbi:hypothetical protein BHE74_00027416 [Ensete ventricosum]|nr:hypothetical protein GW17_00042242 [Ensete ventricosum]RWW65285.1 hypothetical protein BHE74_00027416 [Ensete ventricosum]RZR76218.1 hypothetical protein BHM03_00000851 [Ensete ventricosum]
MASSVIAAAKPLLHPSHPRAPPPSRGAGGPSLRWSLPVSRRSAALRVHALKCEPSKVCCHPSMRFLIASVDICILMSVFFVLEFRWLRKPIGYSFDSRSSPRFPSFSSNSDVYNCLIVALAQKSAGGVLLPKSAVKFERYLMGEVRNKRLI